MSKLKLNFKNSLFIHFSGSEDISALKALHDKKANAAAFHIMQTFPSKKTVDIKNCYAAIEIKAKPVELFLNKLAVDLKLNPVEIDSNKKTLYHLAGVFASNFFTGNLYTSEFLLNKCTGNDINAQELLKPIINSTLLNIKNNGASGALSGPVQRGDIKTIKKHLSEIILLKNRELKLSYITQSLNLLNLIKDDDMKPEHSMIKELLIAELKRSI